MEKSANQTLSDQIHDSILEMVIDAGADSDSMLLTEGALVERFKVSKAPIREALLKLCNEEVLKSIPRCGYVVVRLSEKSARDNIAVRSVLELGALELNFDRFSSSLMESIRQNLDSARNALKAPNVWNVWQQNADFHCLLISAPDNQYFIKHLKNCIDLEKRFYAQNQWAISKRFETIFDPKSHEQIYQAIIDRDKHRALELLRNDISYGT